MKILEQKKKTNSKKKSLKKSSAKFLSRMAQKKKLSTDRKHPNGAYNTCPFPKARFHGKKDPFS